MTATLRMSEEQLAEIVKRSHPVKVKRGMDQPSERKLPMSREEAKRRKCESEARRRNARKNKFNAEKTGVDGIEFASKKEAKRYGELRIMEKAGIITDLKLQPKIVLSAGGIHICDYVADFFYIMHGFPDGSHPVHEDCKGFKTPVYRLKKKIVLALTGIDILET